MLDVLLFHDQCWLRPPKDGAVPAGWGSQGKCGLQRLPSPGISNLRAGNPCRVCEAFSLPQCEDSRTPVVDSAHRSIHALRITGKMQYALRAWRLSGSENRAIAGHGDQEDREAVGANAQYAEIGGPSPVMGHEAGARAGDHRCQLRHCTWRPADVPARFRRGLGHLRRRRAPACTCCYPG